MPKLTLITPLKKDQITEVASVTQLFTFSIIASVLNCMAIFRITVLNSTLPSALLAIFLNRLIQEQHLKMTYEYLKDQLKANNEKEVEEAINEHSDTIRFPALFIQLSTLLSLLYVLSHSSEKEKISQTHLQCWVNLLSFAVIQCLPYLQSANHNAKASLKKSAVAWFNWPFEMVHDRQFHRQLNATFGNAQERILWKKDHDKTSLEKPILTLSYDALKKEFGEFAHLVMEKITAVFNQFDIKNQFDHRNRRFIAWKKDLTSADEKRFFDTLTKTIEICRRTSKISKDIKLFAQQLDSFGFSCKVEQTPEIKAPFLTHTIILRDIGIHTLPPELTTIPGLLITCRNGHIKITVDFDTYNKYAKDKLLTALLAAYHKHSEETHHSEAKTDEVTQQEKYQTSRRKEEFVIRNVRFQRRAPASTTDDDDDSASPKAESPSRIIFSDDLKYPSSPLKPQLYPLRDGRNQFGLYQPKQSINPKQEKTHRACVETGHPVFDKYRNAYKTHPRSVGSRLIANTTMRAKNANAKLHVFDTFDPNPTDHVKM